MPGPALVRDRIAQDAEAIQEHNPGPRPLRFLAIRSDAERNSSVPTSFYAACSVNAQQAPRWFGSTFSDSLPRYELLVIAPGSSVIKSPQHVAVCLWVWRGSKQPTAILNHTKQGELVYDPFLGSGTTLVAAELTERVCFGLELDSRYCDVIIERCYTGPGSTEYMVC
jgi:hypothetical protein